MWRVDKNSNYFKWVPTILRIVKSAEQRLSLNSTSTVNNTAPAQAYSLL